MSVNPAKPTLLEDKFILTSEEAAEFLGVRYARSATGSPRAEFLTSISDGSSGSSPPI